MVQISNAVIVATILIAPVLAVPVRPRAGHRRQQRKVQQQQAQQPKQDAAAPAGESRFSKVGGIAGGVLGAVSTGAGLASLIPPPEQAQAREYDEELEARDPAMMNFRKIASVGGTTLGAVSTAAGLAALVPGQTAREYDEELEVREPVVRVPAGNAPAGRRHFRLANGDIVTIASGAAGAAGFGGAVAISQTARDVSYGELD